ncbi:MAG: polymer-forming cytoskeletal protein [Actinobacteria bacterium]|nr:polymer-forming cytoskeletal protein [Actinomycetota bacterium]
MVFSKKDLGDQEISGKEESRTLLTIVGNKAKIEGKLDVSQSIEIGCEVVGEVVVNGKMVIQKEGVVSADVTTIDATIIGKFEGNMKGTGKIEITETGVVGGNIKTDSLVINEGGIFSGKVTRITEGEDKGKKKFKLKEMEEEKVSAKVWKKEKAGEIKEFELGDIDDSLKL